MRIASSTLLRFFIPAALVSACGPDQPPAFGDTDIECRAFRCDTPGLSDACCGDKPIDDGPPGASSGALADSTSDSGTGTTAGVEAGEETATTNAAESTSEGTTGGEPGAWLPELESYALRCKLINGTGLENPTPNATHTRFNLQGTDLGIPLTIGEQLHLFFGDTQGNAVIWAIGEDPDSVGVIDAAAAADDPDVLCTDLAFYVTPDIPSVAAGTNPTIERDFAAGWMTPPKGQPLSDFITEFPAGFPNIPGTFEVPSGALTLGDNVYLTWAGKAEFTPYPRMTVSYLARWDLPRTLPNYQIVRAIDALQGGALGGHFLQVLPLVAGDTVHMLGTGDFRHSGVYLARVPAANLESGAGTEVYDPDAGAWLDPAGLTADQRAAVPPMFESDGVGEIGGVFVPGPDLYVAMYQRELHDDAGAIVDNRIVLRTASAMTGPWSDAVTIIDMADPAFMAAHCCGATCEGEQILHCLAAGLYAAYPLPSPTVTELDDGALALDLAFVVSTWNPYNVVLFETRVRLVPA